MKTYTDMERLEKLYGVLDKMYHEIGLLLEDWSMLDEIGDMDYLQFMRHVYEKYESLIPNGKKISTIRGHKVAVIKYYCETVNSKEEDE